MSEQLPKGWARSRVGDLAEVIGGLTKNAKRDQMPLKRPFLRVANVYANRLNLDDVHSIGVEASELNRSSLVPGDLLVVEGNGSPDQIGRVAIWNGVIPNAVHQNHLIKIRLPESDMGPYLLWWMLSPKGRESIQSVASSTSGLFTLSISKIQDLVVSLAPRKEQERIVAALDERLSELDASVAALERAERNLVRYRAAVLAAACSGKLVPTTQEYTPRPLRELIKDLGQGWSPKCDLTKEAVPGEWAVVTTTAVQPLRYLDNQAKLLPSNLEPRPWLEILAGDFLMTRKGPRKRAGVACLVRNTRPKLMVCDTVYRFRCVESAVTANYLEIALNSPAVVAAIDKQKAGISESGVSLTHDKLGEIRVPVPPLSEQERIVAEVDRHLSRADVLAASIAQAKRRAQRLRRAILAAAFEGRLVPQDPNDEPASVLLERIRAECVADANDNQLRASGPRSQGRKAAVAVATATTGAKTPTRCGRPPGVKNKAKA